MRKRSSAQFPMKSHYSEQLMKKAKDVFERKAKRSLSDGEIELWLDRLSQLGMLFVKNVVEGRTDISHLKDKKP